MEKAISIRNKRASFEFYLLQEFTAGIMLTGTEIKSIRDGKASIADAYCTFRGDELFVLNMHIAEYSLGTIYNHVPNARQETHHRGWSRPRGPDPPGYYDRAVIR